MMTIYERFFSAKLMMIFLPGVFRELMPRPFKPKHISP